ncbi:MAG: DUF6266 family protein [Methanococcaceae archaeon]
MAKVNGGLESRISGMVGPVVFVNFNGGTYVRQAQRPRGKNNWSPLQKDVRKRFSGFCVFWRQSVPESVKQIWESASEKMNGFNLFLKFNLQAFGYDGKLADPERLHLSQGVLSLPHKIKATLVEEEAKEVVISWASDSMSGMDSLNDELMIMAAGENIFTGPISTGAIRKQGAATIQLPEIPEVITGIYLFFQSVERNLYSPDLYFQII